MESDGSLGLVKSDGDERLGRARLGLKSAQLTTIRRLRRLDRFRASEWSFSCFLRLEGKNFNFERLV